MSHSRSLWLFVLLAASSPEALAESGRKPSVSQDSSKGEGNPRSDREVPLEEFLAHAQRHAASLAVVRERRAYANAERVGADSLLADNPTLELAAGPRFEAGTSGAIDFVAALRQPLEIGGQRGRRLGAAARLGERLDAETNAATWALRHEVTVAYWDSVVGRNRVLASEQVHRLAEDMLAIAKRRLDAGEATLIDVRLAEVELARAHREWASAERSLFVARLSLARAAGYSLAAPPWVPTEFREVERLPKLEQLQERARAKHPELLASRARVREADARLRVAEREGWPKPVVGVQVAREGSSVGAPNTILLGTLELPLPLWRNNDGERERSRADQGVVRAEETALERTVDAEIALAYADLLTAEGHIAVLTTAVEPNLRESLELLQRGLDAGELPLATVTLARERFLSARHDLLDAYAAYYRAFADLEYASGQELGLAVSGAAGVKP